MDIRLIVDPPASGPWNMAVDEALFLTAQRDRRATWRFYQWSAPTLTLGYFQGAQARHEHPASASCQLVRRTTGGGAILHDAELTYSLAVPLEQAEARSALEWVERVHAALATVLQRWGVSARRCGTLDHSPPQPEPFLCFQRRTPQDLLVGDSKIAGSAQRKLHGALLQHGSVLLARSQYAPELPGVAELAGANLTADALGEAWWPIIAAAGFASHSAGELTPEEYQWASQLAKDRYAAAAWNDKR